MIDYVVPNEYCYFLLMDQYGQYNSWINVGSIADGSTQTVSQIAIISIADGLTINKLIYS